VDAGNSGERCCALVPEFQLQSWHGPVTVHAVQFPEVSQLGRDH